MKLQFFFWGGGRGGQGGCELRSEAFVKIPFFFFFFFFFFFCENSIFFFWGGEGGVRVDVV